MSPIPYTPLAFDGVVLLGTQHMSIFKTGRISLLKAMTSGSSAFSLAFGIVTKKIFFSCSNSFHHGFNLLYPNS